MLIKYLLVYTIIFFYCVYSNVNFCVAGNNLICISLGRDCEVAERLKLAKLRTAAFPFDWLSTYDTNGIVKLLRQNFFHFLDKQYLLKSGNCIINRYYNILFVHDFPTVKDNTGIIKNFYALDLIADNYLSAYEHVCAKFNRRINRFRRAIKSGKKIVFFRTFGAPDEARKLAAEISRLFPALDYLLVIVHAKKQYDYDWQIARVKNYYSAELIHMHDEFYWFAQEVWDNIFTNLNLIAWPIK